ncbi:MAG: LCP family protein [Clostridia bacterium]|nr:LCP family protein [Clostridia bacterium]
MSKNHEFKTSKQDKRNGIIRFIVFFLICAVVIGSVSVAVILKNNTSFISDLFSSKTTTAIPQETTENQLVDIEEELKGRMKILLYCTDKEMSEIYFLAMADANMNKQIFEIHPLSPDNPEYITALSTGGEKELVSAVEKAEKIRIDKYVASNADTFALAINYMGGLEYSVPERVEYRTDEYTLILTKGDQTIKGETLLKYFRYCKTLGEQTGLQKQGEILCKMFDSYITAENIAKGDKIYEKVLSKLDSKSDISYIEASRAIHTLKNFCESEERQPAKVVLGN